MNVGFQDTKMMFTRYPDNCPREKLAPVRVGFGLGLGLVLRLGGNFPRGQLS